MNRHISIILSLILAFGLALRAADDTPSADTPTNTTTTPTQSIELIKSPDQLYINAPLTNQIGKVFNVDENTEKGFTDDESIKKGFMEDLLDDRPSTYIATDTTWSEDKHYITVDLSKDDWKLNMQPQDSLVVVLTRTERLYEKRPTYNNPTGMDIYYSVRDDDSGKPIWEDDILARVYFIYRGSKTVELSEPLGFHNLNNRLQKIFDDKQKKEQTETTGKAVILNKANKINDIKRLKFVVTMNNGRHFVHVGDSEEDKEIRPMLLSGFQIYKVTPENPHTPPTRLTPRRTVVGSWIDRFNTNTDVNFRYYDYEFVNTRGVLDERNRHISNNEVSYSHSGSLTDLGGFNNFKVSGVSGDTVKWTLDLDVLNDTTNHKKPIEMPDYSWVTFKDDPLDTSPQKNKSLITNKDLKLQRTAVIEHTLYAIPGEPISLYPFYTMYEKMDDNNYRVNFMHWYDYTTGSSVVDEDGYDMISFVGDPSGMFRSKDYGWYASPMFTTDNKHVYAQGEDIMQISSTEDFINFVNRVNAGETNLCAEIPAGTQPLDFRGESVNPIGSDKPWVGSFYGNNCTIKNLSISGNENVGVFGVVDDGAVIANLKIDSSCTITGQKNIGFVGMVNRGDVKIYGIVNDAKLISTGSDSNMGGIIGAVNNNTTNVEGTLEVSNCLFSGELNGVDNATGSNSGNGLVIGYFRRSETIPSKLILKDVIVTSPSTGFGDNENWIYRNGGMGLCEVIVEDCYYEVPEDKFSALTDGSGCVHDFRSIVRIKGKEDYKNFVNRVNNKKQTTLSAVLEADLDFSGDKEVSPIGTSSSVWKGTFLGQHHTIRNLVINTPDKEDVGIFGVVGDGAKIENLKIEACEITGSTNVGFVGNVNRGHVCLNGIVNSSQFKGSRNVGGLIGVIDSQPDPNTPAYVDITGCLFNGSISADIDNNVYQGALLIGYIRNYQNNVHLKFKNDLVTQAGLSTGVSTELNQGSEIYRYSAACIIDDKPEECYYIIATQGFNAISGDASVLAENFVRDWLSGSSEDKWPFDVTDNSVAQRYSEKIIKVIEGSNPSKKFGAYATFFYPRDPFQELNAAGTGMLRSLPKDEYVIAADMAQNFNMKYNVDDGNKEIIEPIIKYRHIFHVKDGKKFAEENMATAEGNAAFIKKNRRHITATAGRDFQIRLDHPYPVETTTRGVFYYKIDDTDYRRICSRIIRVIHDGKVIQETRVSDTFVTDDNGNYIIDEDSWYPVEAKVEYKRKESNPAYPETNIMFYPTGVFDGMGSRAVDETNYYICGGGGHFFRMLACDNPGEGNYKVQVIGTDYNGKIIYLPDKDDIEHELLVQEFDITFLPEKSSVFISEAELEDELKDPDSEYQDVTNEALEKRYGKPSDVINFDEYRALENIDNSALYINKHEITFEIGNGDNKQTLSQMANYFRWPVPWTQSNYGFGYNDRGDYAMQMITNNSIAVPFRSYGVHQGIDNDNQGEGLFDRLFYDNVKKKKKANRLARKADESGAEEGGAEEPEPEENVTQNREVEKGYFYYVNAADDPGIIARLRLEKFCPGTTVHVSCWIAEFTSSAETANLSFNFVARMNDGTRVPIHAHITGYVPRNKRSQWMYVYSSFVPDIADKDFKQSDLSHYEIEIDNNAKSSIGADYAIDDIRVYTVSPEIFADQLEPVCMKETHVGVKVSADFDVLLQSLGKQAVEDAPLVPNQGEWVNLYYTFLDKKKYDDAIADPAKSSDDAFNEAVLKFKYDGDNVSTYGKLKFLTCWEDNEEYNPNSMENSEVAFKAVDGDRELIVFNTMPEDATMQPGKQYIVAMYIIEADAETGTQTGGSTGTQTGSSTGAESGDDNETPATRAEEDGDGGSGDSNSGNNATSGTEDFVPGASSFRIGMDCSKTCIFTVQAAHQIKIDGKIEDQSEEINACRNQSPVVQINLYGKEILQLDENGKPVLDKDGKPVTDSKLMLVEKNAKFDWFAGSMEDFIAIKDDDGTTLWDAMLAFRDAYDDASDLSGIAPHGKYTQAMKDLIREYVEPSADGTRGQLLYLAQTSYVFPPLSLPDGKEQNDEYVLAIPIPVTKTVTETDTETGTETEIKKEYLICSQPTEVHIVVRQRAPRLAHGISTIPYPQYLSDVPLRISLDRMEKSSTTEETASNWTTPLVLPFRTVAPVTDNVKEMQRLNRNNSGTPIVLASTNDPQYKDLYPANGVAEDMLWTIGEVIDLVAREDEKEIKKAFVKMVFYSDPNDPGTIQFKEGYEYRMRFLFEEKPEGGLSADDVCSGHVVFTIKIVPEYQEWTGLAKNFTGEDSNMNWNNDRNWKRVSSVDILFAEDATSKYITDGANPNTFSYAPLDFTKVVIPHGATVPELFEVHNSPISMLIPKTPLSEDQTDYLEKKGEVWNDTPSANSKSGDATQLVQYDMIQLVEAEDGPTYCRPWVANWCDQIHFESGAEIGHQQHLNYKKAWVDFETEPYRWYTLASPLQGVVAGDMYLPTASARQETEYFTPIEYKPELNDRFEPAVYQRSWNKSEAVVYHYNSVSSKDDYENTNDTTHVQVRANWSNVYNDVAVGYKRGEGFSIKSDISGLDKASQPDKVLFRLPKADTEYTYHSESGTESGNTTSIAPERLYRLNDVEVSFQANLEAATEDNTMFLVGNPFMAHMNITEFLKENSGAVEPMYWILDGDRQGAAVMGDVVNSTLANPEYIAPMQGFFVKAKAPGKSLTVTFDEATMAKTVNDDQILKDVLTRSGEAEEESRSAGLLITARGSGSSALIAFDGAADSGYRESEDAMFVSDATLDAPALVYTVADGTATTVNVLPEIVSTEIGVMTKDGGETTLLFEGVDSSMGLMLYDTEDDSYTDLYDGMEVKVDGNASRRLFIVSGMEQEVSTELDIILMGNAVRVVSTEGGLSARVFDIDGKLIDSNLDAGFEAMFELPKGIYVVEAADSVSRKTKKVMIK